MKKLFLTLLGVLLIASTSWGADMLDTFTGADNTALADHTADTGETWIENTAVATGTAVLSSNRVRSNSEAISIHHPNWTPSSADYSVSVDLYFYTAPVTTTNRHIGIGLRAATNAYTGYYVIFSTGAIQSLKLYRAGNTTPIGEFVVTGYSAGETHNLSLWVSGNNIFVGWDSAVVIVVVASGADIVSAPGSPALYVARTAGVATNIHADNFTASDNLPETTLNATTSNLLDNGYDNVSAPRQSTFARILVQTNAPYIRLSGTTSIYGSYPQYAQLGVKIDGNTSSPLAFTANGVASSVYMLGAGTHNIDVVSGLQTKPGASTLGTFIDSITYPDGYSLTVLSESRERLLIYGDSIVAGGNAANPETAAFPVLLRSWKYDVMVEAWGYRTLHGDASTEGLRNAFVSRIAGYAPSIIYLDIGTNDYALNKWSATDFGTAYALTVDALHAAIPSAKIVCQTPIVRVSEVANTFGNTTGDYRNQIATVVSTRSWAKLIDGTTILELTDLDDNVHPSTEGHIVYYEAIKGYLQQFYGSRGGGGYGSWSWGWHR